MGSGTAKPYVKFSSNASVAVAGSSHLVRFQQYGILLDCGLSQGHDVATDYQNNKDFLKSVRVKEIQWVILSHPHADHSALVPALFAKGAQAHVFVPLGSKPILRLLWEDSLKIHQSDCIKLNNRHGKGYSPFYTADDIETALGRCIEVDYHQKTNLTKNIWFEYYPAGHILYSAQVYLSMTQGYKEYKVGFSGDVGGQTERPYTTPYEPLPFVDMLIHECTYCQPTRPNSVKDRPKDIEKIEAVVRDSHRILFPCFSLQRTQELLTVLYEMWEDRLLPDIPVYLDSPLAIKISNIWPETDEWKAVMNWPRLKFITETMDSKALQMSNEHCIIIAASGFLSGGRILSHLTTALPNPNNTLMFIGYSGENNLASKIKSGEPFVEVNGVVLENKAKIVELRSWSSHASYEELMDYLTTLRYNKVCLVHGDMDGKVSFAKTLKEKLIEQGKSSRVVVVNQDSKLYI